MEYSQAVEQFEVGTNIHPDDQDMLFNLAISQKALGDIDSAITSYNRLLDLNKNHVDALYNIAGCYRENGETKSAIHYYELVVQLDPENGSATNNLAFTLHVEGEIEKALYYYKKLLQLRPDHGPATHMIAALEGTTPVQPPDEYVRDVFDNYSATYDESLRDKLNYSVPGKIRSMFDNLPGLPDSFEQGVDLGCGTGLSARAFQDIVNEFHGIDLSPKMLELAREKNIYSRLFAGNILDILGQRIGNNPYDLIVAADVFTYIGELREIFKMVKRGSSLMSVFCFSTEKADSGDYLLRPSGRYAHSREYIEKALAENGWHLLICEDADLRKEKGEWVQGNLWIANRIDTKSS